MKDKGYYITKIVNELERAEVLFPVWPPDLCHQVAILNEESGEVTKAVLDYLYKGKEPSDIETELIQTAAMALRMLLNLKNKQVCPVCKRDKTYVTTAIHCDTCAINSEI